MKEENIINDPLTKIEKIKLRTELGIPYNHMVISVGRFIPSKGFDVLIKAAKKFKEDTGVYIIGGEPTKEYNELIKQYDINNVHFLSFLEYCLSTGNVYVTNRSGTAYVLDEKHRNSINGTFIKMKHVSSISECNSTPHSYFIDGADVYVHTVDGREPDGNIHAILTIKGAQFKLTNSTLYMEGFYFNVNNGLVVEGDINLTFVNNRVNIGRTTVGNSLGIQGVGTTMSFNSIGHDSMKDVFNYHYYNIPVEQRRDVFVFEYYCEGFNAGLDDTVTTNNATTAHEGINILRVGTKGDNTNGFPLADINGCYSVLIDVDMGGSVSEHPSYVFAYCFHTDNDPTGEGAKVYMINSGGKGSVKGSNILTDSGTELYLESYYEGLDGIKGSGEVFAM